MQWLGCLEYWGYVCLFLFNLVGNAAGFQLLACDSQTFDDEPVPLSVWTSTLKRTISTAEHLPFPKLRWKAIDEIDAGDCNGMSYKEVQETMPEEFEARKRDKLNYR